MKNNVHFFSFAEDASKEHQKDIKEYELNKEYEIEDHKITFLKILQKEEESAYYYKYFSLFESLEGPNNKPDLEVGESLFREKYFYSEDKNIYLSKYVTNYYPALSVSPPDFSKTGSHFWIEGDETDPGLAATKLYKAFRTENKIPFTLFLKPHTRQ